MSHNANNAPKVAGYDVKQEDWDKWFSKEGCPYCESKDVEIIRRECFIVEGRRSKKKCYSCGRVFFVEVQE